MKQSFSCGIQWMPLREAPSEAAECGTVLLYGETYRVIQTVKNENGSIWHHVLCDHDSYAGYISDAYHRLALNVPNPTFRVTQAYVSDQHPKGWVSPGALVTSNSVHTKAVEDKQAFLMQYLHTPYLWGGRSIWGIDCSGLSQIFLQICGVSIPRNASEQALLGEMVDFSSQQLGDLAFFHAVDATNTEQVSHVGIVLKPGEIIHASGMVRVDLLNKEGIFRSTDGVQTHRLMWIKRFI